MGAVSDALKNLITLLDLEELEVNIFRGVSPTEDRQRVFGGQVCGQALLVVSIAQGRPHPAACRLTWVIDWG